MRKITFLLFMLVTSISFAQVFISENFDSGTPAGWTDSYSNTSTGACMGNSERDNLWSSSTTGNLTSPNQVGLSNGTDLTVSFDYKIVEYSPITDPTPAGWGTAELQYSTDDGVTWNTVLTIDDSNHVVSTDCANMMVTIPAASLPLGSDVKLQIANVWVAGDYYFYVDNFNAGQVVVTPPNCDSVLTETTDVSIAGDISWNAATGLPTGYNLTVGTSSGGSDILATTDVGNVTSYSLGALAPGTVHYVTIEPYNANGSATGCTEQTFTTFVPPANDECDNAIGLTVNADLACGSITSGTTQFATASSEPDEITGTPNTDVWFSFVATTTAHRIELSNVVNLGGGTSTSTDMGMAVYDGTGTCSSLSLIGSSDPNTYNVGDLIPTNTYYVRVYGWSTSIQYNSFDICVGTLPDPPANDICSNAIVLNESTDFNCNNTISGTTVDALPSAEDDCSTTNKDVWYTLTASQTNTYKFLVTETMDYGSSSTYVSVFEGSCGTLTQVGTTCFSSNINVDLTSGNTYYVNVRSTSTTTGVDFDLCAYPYPPAPSNDDCGNALVLTESANDGSCVNTVSGTTVSATASAEDDCSTTNKDVWYTLTAAETNTYKFLVTETQDFGSSSTYVSVFEGSCGGLTQVGTACFSSTVNVDLTSGNTYYVNVRSTSTTEGVNFDLCAFPNPPAPANDDCSGAITLNESTDSTCNNVVSGTTVSATASTEDDCSTTNKDVWYSFTPLQTNDYVLTVTETQDFGSSSTYVSIFEGSCGGLTQVGTACNSTSVIESLTASTTYYVNVRSTSSSEGVNFDLCAFVLPPPPVNDDCSGATVLTPGGIYSDNPVDGTVLAATADAEDVDNCGEPGPGVWYSLTVPASGSITIETGPDSATGNTAFDSVIEAFTGTCGALTSIECDDDDAATGNFSLLNLTGLTGGSVIYVRVWEYGGNEIEPFSISAYDATLGVDTNVFQGFKYYPNPVEGTLSLRAQQNMQSIAVYNMLGQEVINISPNTMSKDLDMSALSRGAYFVRVSIDGAVESFKIIKE